MTTEGSISAQAPEGEADLIFEGRPSVLALVGPALGSMFWLIVSIVLFMAAGPLCELIAKNKTVQALSNTLTGQINLSTISLLGYTPIELLVFGFRILACFFLIVALKRIFKVLWHWLSTSYRLTTHRIEIEQGIFSKSVQNFELWRVQDINYTRSFWEFVFRLGRIHVKALDARSEDVFLIGPIPDARKVYDRLKDARLAAGQRAGAQAMGVVG